MRNLGLKIGAAALAGFTSGVLSLQAHAQQLITTPQSRGVNLDSVVREINYQAQNIPDLIATLAYICGALFTAFGIISIKKHIDNPTNDPLKKGLGQLAVGGALLTVPAISHIMTNSFDLRYDTSALLKTFGIKL